MHESRSSLGGSIVLFALSASALFYLTGDVFHPSMEEGIYLEAGSRVAAGEVPYRDFYAHAGPLVYWLQALLELAFGRNLPMLRLSVAVAFGLCTAGVYGMTSVLRGGRAATVAALVFLGLTSASLPRFTIGHRWLSTGLFSVAVAMAMRAELPVKHRTRFAMAAGCFGAAAAWATPTFVLPLVMMLLWFAFRSEEADGWHQSLRCGMGVVAASAPAVVWLTAQGAMLPMLETLLGAARKYRRSDVVLYGYYPGLQFTSSLRYTLNQLRVLLPAAGIPIALAWAAVEIAQRKRRGAWELLAVLALGMFLSCYPSWDASQLLYVAPPFYALAAIWVCDLRIHGLSRAIAYASLILSAIFVSLLVSQVDSFSYFPTRAGVLRHVRESGTALAALEQRIPAGASILVYPYMPLLRWMLDGRNPTSFSYMQPGMMPEADEQRMLKELEAHPPDYVLRQYLPEDQVLSVWPNSNRSRLKFSLVDRFVDEHYEDVNRVRALNFDIRVMVRVR